MARLFAGQVDAIPAGTEIDFTDLNGEPAAVLRVGPDPYAVLTLDVDPDSNRVTAIRIVANPAKLSGLTLG